MTGQKCFDKGLSGECWNGRRGKQIFESKQGKVLVAKAWICCRLLLTYILILLTAMQLIAILIK